MSRLMQPILTICAILNPASRSTLGTPRRSRSSVSRRHGDQIPVRRCGDRWTVVRPGRRFASCRGHHPIAVVREISFSHMMLRAGFTWRNLICRLELVRSHSTTSIRQNGNVTSDFLPGKDYGDDQPLVNVDKTIGGPCSNRVYSPWLNVDSLARSMIVHSANSGVSVTPIGAGDNSTFPNRTTRLAIGSDGK